MFIYPVSWDKISVKDGDNLTVEITPVQRALLIAVLINVQAIGETAPESMNIGEDSDNFDAVISDLMSKIASV